MNKKLSGIFISVIVALGILFSGVISLLSLFLTTDDSSYRDAPMTIKLAPSILVGIAVFIIFFVSPLRKKVFSLKYSSVARLLFIYGLLASVLWVIIANVLPMWDSASIVSAAQFLDHSRSAEAVSQWSEGGYLQRFPHQTPLVLFFYLCIKIAGSNSVLLFEFLNCVACAISMYLIVRYTYLISRNNSAAVLSGVLVALFLPIILYCTFIYGDIICLPFVLGSVYLQAVVLLNKEKRVKNFALSSILGIIAVLLKPSSILIILAMGVTYIIYGLRNKKLAIVVAAITIVILAKATILPINAFLENKTKANLHDGMGSMTWITMGIGGGKEYWADQGDDAQRDSLIMPGYYDAFLWILPNEEYSSERMQEVSSSYLGKRLSHFGNNPGFALSFFTTKFVTEWTEPLFESLLVSNWRSDIVGPYSMRDRELSPVASSVYYGKINAMVTYTCDCMQTILSVGLLSYLLFFRKKLKTYQLTPVVYILGVAVLYLFWENKTEYFLTAFLLMVPLAGIGWASTFDYFRTKTQSVLKKRLNAQK